MSNERIELFRWAYVISAVLTYKYIWDDPMNSVSGWRFLDVFSHGEWFCDLSSY